MVVNLPDWGLANEVLPEWQATPGLVQVQALTSEVEERRFGNSFDAAEIAQEQAALRAALRKAQSAQQDALKAALHEAQVAQRSEAALRRELEAILDSTIWRASAPLRMAAGKLPSSLRTMARTGLQAVYWVLTPWDTPKRLRFLRERYRHRLGL
jgi:hypothetical protein